jgi:glycosyltransferase involved in cell wall biosynthesis
MSLTEGLGKLLNYMATALPTVAFDIPVAREYLGSDGHLALRGDVESLAAKMMASLYPAATDTWNREMGKRLRQRAIQLFAWDQVGQMIVNSYRELLEQRAGRLSRKAIPAQGNDQLVERR